MKFQFADKILDLSTPKVMGILNVTPDSFYDGGRFIPASSSAQVNVEKALAEASTMVKEGAAFIDIGGESTRPGAKPVGEQEEMDRVLPVVECLARELDTVLSIDSSSPSLMLEAAKLGAGLLNDVRALQKEGAVAAAAETGLPVCLMHMQGTPETMQQNPSYSDVFGGVESFLKSRIDACVDAGISTSQILLDPGFGFGKTDEHNLLLLKHLQSFGHFECPILVGLSRKSMIGRLLGRDVEDRLPASLALAMASVQNGANILRVHDVAATVDVVNIMNALQSCDLKDI